MLRRFTERLFAVDLLTILFAAALSVVALAGIGFGRPVVPAGCAAIVVGLWSLALLDFNVRSWPIAFVHDWAFAPLAYACYLLVGLTVKPLRGAWIADPLLIAIDRAVLGADASLVLAPLAHPWLTEVLQLAYTSFYALMVTVGAELYAKRDSRRFRVYAFSCAVGFFVSFVGYMAVPAVGPRFTLFDVATVERELPGLWLTPALRQFVDGGGLVPPGLSQAAAAALAPRDVFPSGHTMMTIIAMYWSWRFRLRVRWGIWVVGGLLVFATVYLRYHYAVDIAAGMLLAVGCLAVTPGVYHWITGRLGTRGGE